MDELDTPSISRRNFLARGALGVGALGFARILTPLSPAASGDGIAADKGVATSLREPVGAPSGGWWQYRRDQRLSGRSPLKGAIERPALEWSHEIAGRETLLAARVSRRGPASIALPVTDVPTIGPSPRWTEILKEWSVSSIPGGSWMDLDGDGRLTWVAPTANQKIGKVLLDRPGLQLIETEPRGLEWRPTTRKGVVSLKVREQGQWVTWWQTETDTLIWQAEPIVGDFDGDGNVEVALLPWYRLTLLDGATGSLKQQCNFLAEDESENPHNGGRAYGWFGAVDVGGETVFAIIDDFTRYAAAVGWRHGRLERLWVTVWEPHRIDDQMPAPEDATIVRVGAEPVLDVDGDGRKEIVVSVFNAVRDGRWHVVVLDVLTGATKLDLPGQFLTGIADADGDGTPELFCTAVERGPRIPDPAELSIWTVRPGTAAPIWRLAGASFVTGFASAFPAHVNSGATLGGDIVLLGKSAPGAFFTRRAGSQPREFEVMCWHAEAGRRLRRLATWIGPDLLPLAARVDSDGAHEILLKATALADQPARVRSPRRRTQTRVLASQRVSAPLSPAVVGSPGPGALPIIVVQGACETVEGFRPDGRGRASRVWRVRGRGMTCSNFFEGALIADLGGGAPAVVVGTRGAGNCARLSAISARDGRPVWVQDFADFPGAPPAWNVPGLMYWQGGYFRDRTRMDLLVQMRRVGGESYLLDGRSGRVLWRQTRGSKGRDFGRAFMAMADFDGDGLEDVLNVFPDMFCVARGRDGELLVAEESTEYVDIHAYYADVLTADFLGRGEPQVLYLHELVTVLFSLSGERIWKLEHHHPEAWRQPAGWGNAAGDGRIALFFPGARASTGREFQCRDAATGELEWSLPMPDAPLTFPAVADIDGDGRDECLFTMGKTVYAVGATQAGGGSIAWTLDLPARAGPLAIADVHGDGVARIVVGCADGRVYGIGPASAG